MGRKQNLNTLKIAKEMLEQGKSYIQINNALRSKFNVGISPNTVTNLKRELKNPIPKEESNKKPKISSEPIKPAISLITNEPLTISEIIYEEKFNTNNYDNKKFSLKVSIDPHQVDPISAFFILKLKVDKAFKILQFYDKLIHEKISLEKALQNPKLVIETKNQMIQDLELLNKRIKIMVQKKMEIEQFMTMNFLNSDQEDNEEKLKEEKK
jgi:hypothetical protein